MTWTELGIACSIVLGIGNIFYTYLANKRTRFTQTITAERLKWINSTRETVASLCGAVYSWLRVHSVPSNEETRLRCEIDRLRMLATLQFNPHGPSEKELTDSFKLIPEYMNKTDELTKLLESIVGQAQILLNTQWRKSVKEADRGIA